MQPKAVLALLATAFGAIQDVQARGEFSRSCTNYYIENNNFLRATCKNASGGQVNSALNLNACIGIASTSLVCRANGNYAANGCRACLIRTGAYMLCGCPGGNKIADLDECVANRNGLLACA
ncbi:Cyanovirin-N [Coprinellus micaceus]|uniref:Cyanovirin-N n=1 Tax=Coprinellus micaceus TaxID=71717 RepID=A0A4Y7SKM6_COPMI|nr:Cyanovirin-N [Coprinellus micaceus]